jgi:hypothetical protein
MTAQPLTDPAPADRIPTDFQYWENFEKPYAKGIRAGMRLAFGVKPDLPDDIVRTYGQMYYDADPVAEAFVEEVYLKRGQAAGRAMLDQALAGGVENVSDAPESLRTLFGELEEDPAWVDWDLVDLGAKSFRRFGTRMHSMAGAITLHGYLENSVAKPLAFTGTYGGSTAQKRFLETARFWIDVSEPGGMRPGAQGRATAMRVRIMHVFVRKGLLRHPKWDLKAWGVPISQGDALLTLMGGSFVPGYLMRLLGYRTSRAEILAMMHFWRYVGHVMGVQPRWYPQTIEEAAGLMFAAEVKGVQGGGEDARHLALSYVASYKPSPAAQRKRSPAERFTYLTDYWMQLGYVGMFVPPHTHKHYGLPGPGLARILPLLQVPGNFLADTLRRRSKRLDRWLDDRAREQARAWVGSRLGPREAEFRAVEEFTR